MFLSASKYIPLVRTPKRFPFLPAVRDLQTSYICFSLNFILHSFLFCSNLPAIIVFSLILFPHHFTPSFLFSFLPSLVPSVLNSFLLPSRLLMVPYLLPSFTSVSFYFPYILFLSYSYPFFSFSFFISTFPSAFPVFHRSLFSSLFLSFFPTYHAHSYLPSLLLTYSFLPFFLHIFLLYLFPSYSYPFFTFSFLLSTLRSPFLPSIVPYFSSFFLPFFPKYHAHSYLPYLLPYVFLPSVLVFFFSLLPS